MTADNLSFARKRSCDSCIALQLQPLPTEGAAASPVLCVHFYDRQLFPSVSPPPDLLTGLVDTFSPLKPFLPPTTFPSSSSSSRAGSEPPPSSPPSALPATGNSSSSPKASPPPPPAPAVASSVSPALPPPPPAPAASQASSNDAPPSAESEEEKAKKLLYCSLCKVAVNSLSQLEAHNAGEAAW